MIMQTLLFLFSYILNLRQSDPRSNLKSNPRPGFVNPIQILIQTYTLIYNCNTGLRTIQYGGKFEWFEIRRTMFKTCVYYNIGDGRLWKNYICTGNAVMQLGTYISGSFFVKYSVFYFPRTLLHATKSKL